KKLVSEYSESTLLVIENCGHVVNVENPEMFNAKVIQFIKELA
ncbi:MAG: pimeloyl-ACP methyl ester carboxylesterase, partial [Candidatus Endobugula sp.]